MPAQSAPGRSISKCTVRAVEGRAAGAFVEPDHADADVTTARFPKVQWA
jgi:hypothetical protein